MDFSDVGPSYPGAGENLPSLHNGNIMVINELKTVKAFHSELFYANISLLYLQVPVIIQ